MNSTSISDHDVIFVWSKFFHNNMETKQKSRFRNNQLMLDFGPFYQNRPAAPREGLFQRVRSEMLKRRERAALRRKPLEYEKLEGSLTAKLKMKSFNR